MGLALVCHLLCFAIAAIYAPPTTAQEVALAAEFLEQNPVLSVSPAR